MTQVAPPPVRDSLPRRSALLAPVPGRGAPAPLNDRARKWLTRLMFLGERWPLLAVLIRPLAIDLSWRTSPELRTGTLANAARILGPESSKRARRRLARRVNGNFYDFLVEMGASRRRGRGRPVAEVIGAEHLDRAIARGQGVVMATAHLGSFESGIEALRSVSPRVHVVFQQRGDLPDFERLRCEHRRRLGVFEIAIDEGIVAWARAQRALEAGDIVLIQGDRVMPGQRGAPVRFLGGHLLAPIGPVKLARMTGSPIVPVFALRQGFLGRQVRIIIGEPIEPPPCVEHDRDALEQLMGVIEARVAEAPDQWLMLHAAWLEDQED